MDLPKLAEIKIFSFIPLFFQRFWLLILKIIGSRQDVLAFVAVIYGGYLIKTIQEPMWRVLAYISCIIYIAIYQKLITVKDVDVDVVLGNGAKANEASGNIA